MRRLALVVCGCVGLLGCGETDPEQSKPATPVETWKLSIEKPQNPLDAALTGQGSVTVGLDALECDGCTVEVPRGQSAVFTAIAAHDSAFHSWKSTPSGLCEDEANPSCTVIPAAAGKLEAYFVTRGTNLWAHPVGAASFDEVTVARPDAAGNVFVTGCFSDEVTFGTKTETGRGQCDVFVVKLDSSGHVLASAVFGGASNDESRLLEVLSDGGVAVAGWFTGAQEVIELPNGDQIVTDLSANDAFVAFFDSALKFRGMWHVLGSGSQSVEALGATASGELFVVGSSGNKLDLATSVFAAPYFIAKLDGSGALSWLEPFGGVPINASLTTDTGDLVLGLNPESNIVLGGACPDLTPSQPWQGFVATFDGGGVCKTARRLASNGEDASIVAMTRSAAGNVYVAGKFTGTIHLDASDPNAVLQSPDLFPGFVVKLGPDLEWKPGVSYVRGYDEATQIVSIAVDDDENVLVGLNLEGAWPNVPSYFHDIVIEKLDASGQSVFLHHFGGKSSESISSVAWDGTSRAWLVAGAHGDGLFTDPIDFGGIQPNPLSFSVRDGLVAKFSP